MAMAKVENVKELDELRERAFSEADKIVKVHLPEKILALHRAYTTTRQRRIDDETEITGGIDALVEIRDNPEMEVGVNKVINDAIQLLKKDIVAMLSEVATLKLWIRLNVPQIEDGNTFGVEVQQEVISMLGSLYSSALAFLHSLSTYFYKRGKLISDMRKRPWVKEYAQAVYDLDDKQYINLVQSCYDLRNNYLFLSDKLTKNSEKLLRPKGRTSVTDFNMY